MKNQLLICLAILTLMGCGKSDDLPLTINETEVKLHYDGEFIFSIKNAPSVEWTSSDEFVGTIGSDGKFEARHIGETTITAKVKWQTVTAKVVVEPTVVGVIEPYMVFGKRKHDVKNVETRQLANETPATVFYTETSAYTFGAIYHFENNLFTAVDLLWNDAKMEDSYVFYAERYELTSTSNNVYSFRDKSKSMVVELSYERSPVGYTATYSKNTSTK